MAISHQFTMSEAGLERHQQVLCVQEVAKASKSTLPLSLFTGGGAYLLPVPGETASLSLRVNAAGGFPPFAVVLACNRILEG